MEETIPTLNNEKKKKPPTIAKLNVDEFLKGKPPLGETSRKLFRQKSIGCKDLEKLYKEFSR